MPVPFIHPNRKSPNNDRRRQKKTSEGRNKSLQHGQFLRIDAVTHLGAIYFPLHQSRLLQDLQMLRNRRLGQRHLIDDLSTNTRTATDQQTQNSHSGRMCNGPCHRCYLLGRLIRRQPAPFCFVTARLVFDCSFRHENRPKIQYRR